MRGDGLWNGELRLFAMLKVWRPDDVDSLQASSTIEFHSLTSSCPDTDVSDSVVAVDPNVDDVNCDSLSGTPNPSPSVPLKTGRMFPPPPLLLLLPSTVGDETENVLSNFSFVSPTVVTSVTVVVVGGEAAAAAKAELAPSE